MSATGAKRHPRVALVGACWIGAIGLGSSGACRSFDYCARAGQCSSQAGEAAGGTEGDSGARGGAAGAAAGGEEAAAGGAARGEGGDRGVEIGGAAGESSGGMGGDGGRPPACSAPYGECDGSLFTTCETDRSTSPLHCGACGARCPGVCSGGVCLETTTLVEGQLPLARGLVRVGSSFFVLTAEALSTFKEGQQIAQKLRLNTEGLVALEAGTDRLYLGDEAGRWWSASLADPSTLEDLGITALDATVLDGALYWLATSQTVRVQLPSGGSVEYCHLPEPAFDFESGGLTRVSDSTLAVFRRGSAAGDEYSDIWVCPELNDPSPGRPGLGERVAEAGALRIARADEGALFWSDGRRLFGLQRGGGVEELFTAPDDDRGGGSFVLAGSALVWAYAKDFTAGLFVIARDAKRAPRLLGTLGQPRALYLEPFSQRLCYANDLRQSVSCLPLAALTAEN